MKNYIEHVHESRGEGETYVDESRTVWWAVSPTGDQYRHAPKGGELPDWKPQHDQAFILIGGQGVYIYDKEDLAGLRGLLDEIEKEMES